MASIQGFNFQGSRGPKHRVALIQGLAWPRPPGDSELRPGGEGERTHGSVGGLRVGGGRLGFRITANHRGIKMFTGCGGISSPLMTFNVIIFAL